MITSPVATITGTQLDNVFTGTNGLLKKTSVGTYTLDTNSYLTSLSGAVLTSQSTPQIIGLTGSRLSKLWTTDLDVTNIITGSISGNAGTVTNGVYLNTANTFTNPAPMTTLAESWIGPSSTTGIYFKGGNVGVGTTSPNQLLSVGSSNQFTVNSSGNLTTMGSITSSNINTGTNYVSIIASITTRRYDAVVKVTSTSEGSIATALAAITDNGPNKRYELYLPNGTYTENALQMRNYIDMIGQSMVGVIINNNPTACNTYLGLCDTIIMGGVDDMLANVTVNHTGRVGTGTDYNYGYAIHLDGNGDLQQGTTNYSGNLPTGSGATTIIYNSTLNNFAPNPKHAIGIGLRSKNRLFLLNDYFNSPNGGSALFGHNYTTGTSPNEMYVINSVGNAADGTGANGDGFQFADIDNGNSPDRISVYGGTWKGTGTGYFDMVIKNGTGTGNNGMYVSLDSNVTYSTHCFYGGTNGTCDNNSNEDLTKISLNAPPMVNMPAYWQPWQFGYTPSLMTSHNGTLISDSGIKIGTGLTTAAPSNGLITQGQIATGITGSNIISSSANIDIEGNTANNLQALYIRNANGSALSSASVDFSTYGPSIGPVAQIKAINESGTTDTGLSFSVYQSGLKEMLGIRASGIGIGDAGTLSAFPASGNTLDVNGTAQIRGTVNGTSGLFVDSSGNVEIGTTSATSPYNLSVVHANAGGAMGILIKNSAATTLNNEADLSFGTWSSSYGTSARIAAVEKNASNGASDLVFSSNNAGTLTEGLRIDKSQNVIVSNDLQFASGSYNSSFLAGTQSGNISYTLPIAQGGSNTVLQNNGSGTLSWGVAGVPYTGASANFNLNSNELINTSGIYDNATAISQVSSYPPAQNTTYVVATSWIGSPNGTAYDPWGTTDPTKSLTAGYGSGNQWLTTSNTNQSFQIDMGASFSGIVTQVYYENGHNAANDTYLLIGPKDFTLWGSNSSASFTDTTYADDTGWTQITAVDSVTGLTQLQEHSGTLFPDPHYLTVTNSTTYRYYRFKFADTWGTSSGHYMGVRRIELQTSTTSSAPKLSIDSNNRKLYGTDGSTAMIDYSTLGTVNFGTQNIITSGNVGIGTSPAGYLLQVGSSSTTTGTTVARFQNAGGNCDIVPSTSGGITCSSDMNLKKNIDILESGTAWSEANITTMPSTILDKVLALNPVTYNWKVEQDIDPKHTGFIAQDVQQVFPDLVSTDPVTHLLSLNYSGMTPYIVKAVQEMNLKLDGIAGTVTPVAGSENETFVVAFFKNIKSVITNWLADATNGITKIFVGEVDSNTINSDNVKTNTLCVGSTCVTEAQLKTLLQNAGTSAIQLQTIPSSPTTTDTTTITNPTPTTTPDPTATTTPDAIPTSQPVVSDPTTQNTDTTPPPTIDPTTVVNPPTTDASTTSQ